MEAMEMKEIEAAVEGILFASGEPVAADRIAVALDLDRDTVDQVLRRLADYYSYERRGMRLVRMEDTWQLCSAPEYADLIRRAFEIRKPAKLSQPALEVLTIIAYYQPTTRAYVDQIRGVDSAYTVGLLRSMPRVDAESYERLIPIECTPVDMLNPPEGCPFAPRCEHAMKICLQKMPPYVELGEGHRSACWLRVQDQLDKAGQEKPVQDQEVSGRE